MSNFLYRKEEKDGNVLFRKDFPTQDAAVRFARNHATRLSWTKGEQFIWADGEEFRYTVLKTS